MYLPYYFVFRFRPYGAGLVDFVLYGQGLRCAFHPFADVQGLRCAPPPACGLVTPTGLHITNAIEVFLLCGKPQKVDLKQPRI